MIDYLVKRYLEKHLSIDISLVNTDKYGLFLLFDGQVISNTFLETFEGDINHG